MGPHKALILTTLLTLTSALPAAAQDVLVVGSSLGLTGYASITAVLARRTRARRRCLNAKGGVARQEDRALHRGQQVRAAGSGRRLSQDDVERQGRADLRQRLRFGRQFRGGRLGRARASCRWSCARSCRNARKSRSGRSASCRRRVSRSTRAMQYLKDKTTIRKIGILHDPTPYATLMKNIAAEAAAELRARDRRRSKPTSRTMPTSACRSAIMNARRRGRHHQDGPGRLHRHGRQEHQAARPRQDAAARQHRRRELASCRPARCWANASFRGAERADARLPSPPGPARDADERLPDAAGAPNTATATPMPARARLGLDDGDREGRREVASRRKAPPCATPSRSINGYPGRDRDLQLLGRTSMSASPRTRYVIAQVVRRQARRGEVERFGAGMTGSPPLHRRPRALGALRTGRTR